MRRILLEQANANSFLAIPEMEKRDERKRLRNLQISWHLAHKASSKKGFRIGSRREFDLRLGFLCESSIPFSLKIYIYIILFYFIFFPKSNKFVYNSASSSWSTDNPRPLHRPTRGCMLAGVADAQTLPSPALLCQQRLQSSTSNKHLAREGPFYEIVANQCSTKNSTSLQAVGPEAELPKAPVAHEKRHTK